MLEHFLDAFEPLCRGLSESSVAMGGRRVSTRVDRFDPLNFLVDKKCSCVGVTPVQDCVDIKIYMYFLYKLHKGLV